MTLTPYLLRPFTMDASTWSFPSGHAVSTFAIATVLAHAYPAYRVWIWLLAVVLSASRFMALTPHYLGDVVAGAGIGAGVALLCLAGLKRRGWV